MPARIVLSALAIAGLALAAYWSIRLARAEFLFRANRLEAVLAAVSLDPGNARYRAWLAELEEHDGRDPTPALRAAAGLNPRDSPVWIRLGLRAELEGDYARAERCLLEAARIDRLTEPRATLMHYYFRRGDWERFWIWSRRALEMAYGDLTPLFRLCWAAAPGQPELVRRRAIPPRPGVLAAYLRFLLAEDRLEAAQPAALDLASRAGAGEAPVLLEYCDRAIAAVPARSGDALPVWNAMCRRKLVPYPPLVPGQTAALTNADFAAVPLLRGFDWHIPPLGEVAAARLSPAGLKLSLSGKQPERCELIWQFVPLLPRRTYRFRFLYQTAGVPEQSGLRWRILGAETPPLAGDDWRPAELTFDSGEAELGRLSLVSERVPGAARAEGSISLRGLALELVR